MSVPAVPTHNDVRWFKSSRSATNGACVEVALVSGAVLVRDSKNPDGGQLMFEPGAWQKFVEHADKFEM